MMRELASMFMSDREHLTEVFLLNGATSHKNQFTVKE